MACASHPAGEQRADADIAKRKNVIPSVEIAQAQRAEACENA